MDRINRKVLGNAKNRLILVEWVDAYDSSDEINIKDFKLTKQIYETPGFFIEVVDDHLIMGINRDTNNEGTYKGYGSIPVSLITNVQLMDRNCGD